MTEDQKEHRRVVSMAIAVLIQLIVAVISLIVAINK